MQRRPLPLFALAAVTISGLAARAEASPALLLSRTGAQQLERASALVVMREGSHTAMTLDTTYLAPAEPHAWLVAVPPGTGPIDVKALPAASVDHVLALTAPRVVETFERDPCDRDDAGASDGKRHRASASRDRARTGRTPQPTFAREAPGALVMAGADAAKVSSHLDEARWSLPDGARDRIEAHARRGGRFVVVTQDKTAKAAHVERLTVRLAFEADALEIPALARSRDLVVAVLARHQRFDVADADEVLLPSPLTLDLRARTQTAEVHEALVDRLFAAHPAADVIEYARDATTCGECPTSALDADDLMTLGADTLPAAPGERESPTFGIGFVLTRLRLRTRDAADPRDVQLTAAAPIAGGREGERAAPAERNDFEPTFTVRHAWEGPSACAHPEHGRWAPQVVRAPRPHGLVSPDAIDLASAVLDDVPEIGLRHQPPAAEDQAAPAATVAARAPEATPTTAPSAATHAGCGGCSLAGGSRAPGAALAAVFALLGAQRRRARSRGRP